MLQEKSEATEEHRFWFANVPKSRIRVIHRAWSVSFLIAVFGFAKVKLPGRQQELWQITQVFEGDSDWESHFAPFKGLAKGASDHSEQHNCKTGINDRETANWNKRTKFENKSAAKWLTSCERLLDDAVGSCCKREEKRVDIDQSD